MIILLFSMQPRRLHWSNDRNLLTCHLPDMWQCTTYQFEYCGSEWLGDRVFEMGHGSNV